jgi:hypothetical protein
MQMMTDALVTIALGIFGILVAIIIAVWHGHSQDPRAGSKTAPQHRVSSPK